MAPMQDAMSTWILLQEKIAVGLADRARSRK